MRRVGLRLPQEPHGHSPTNEVINDGVQVEERPLQPIHARDDQLIPLTQLAQHLLQLWPLTGRATDLILVDLGRPRLLELSDLTIQILTRRADTGVSHQLSSDDMLVFI